MCVNTMPRRKDISNDLREAIVAAHQSGKGYKVISELFGKSGKHSRQLSIYLVLDMIARSRDHASNLRLYRPQNSNP